MDYLQAVISGILQGATEFIPVSSSAHFVILRTFLPMETEAAAMDAFLHLGSLVGLILALEEDIGHLCAQLLLLIRDVLKNAGIFLGSFREREEPRYSRILTSNYRRLTILILLALGPTALIGLVLRRLTLKVYDSLIFTGACLMATGVVLLVVGQIRPYGRLPKEIPLKRGFISGIVQGFCVLPGLSRMGLIMATAILMGFSRQMAVRYACLVGIPAIVGAALLEISTAFYGGAITSASIGLYLAGMAASCLSSFVFVKGMLRLSRSLSLTVFAVYNLVMGVAAIVLFMMPVG